MQNVPITRAAHVIEICEILREIGSPVERELSRAKLPTLIEETPDAFVNSIYGMEFAKNCADLEGIEDLGWLAAKKFKASQLNSDLVAALKSEPTVKLRLEKLFELSALEDSDFRPVYRRINGSTQVFADGGHPTSFYGYEISEWLQIAVVIEPIRSILGGDWAPDEISFSSDFKVCDEAHAAYPNTRFRTNAARTSISFPTGLLSASTLAIRQTQNNGVPGPFVPTTFAKILQSLATPYLRDSRLPIGEASELMGMSTRALQRKLHAEGLRYVDLLENARFQMAVDMLKDPKMRLIEIAQAVGYEDQSNLGRCFRRIAGTSPGNYRRLMLGGQQKAFV